MSAHARSTLVSVAIGVAGGSVAGGLGYAPTDWRWWLVVALAIGARILGEVSA